MTFLEIIKTIFGYYRNDYKGNGWIQGPEIWVPKEKYYINQDLREIDEFDGEKGLTKDEIEELNKVESSKIEEKDIFEMVTGHDSLKLIFNHALASNEQVHILLSGAPGSAKSLFLEAIAENVRKSYFITNNSTGAGILNYIAEHPKLKYLLIDEIEKIKKEELFVLLTLIETGRLIITKKTMQVNRKQRLAIFATCNRVDKLAPEMRSRFLKFHLQPYKYPEFVLITEEFGKAVAKTVWEDLGSRDVRDCIKIMKLAKKEDDINIIMEAIQEYRENK